ncbi:hypothetical protein ACFL2V_20020 [Pseudomonadota bacterium]
MIKEMEVRKNLVSCLSIFIMVCLLMAPSFDANADDSNINKAVEFLKTACVTKGSSLEMKATGDGSLKLKSLFGSGVSGSITLTKKEIEGFADVASELSAKQATEMRNCMKPFIDKIISALLTGYYEVEPQTIDIKTTGNYFVTSEFDSVMAAISSDPDGWWSVERVQRKIELHPAKIRSYITVATNNELGQYSYARSKFQMYKRGIDYVLAKRLVE